MRHSQYAFDPVEGRKPGARTTLMIRNIPNKYTQAMLLDILEDLCRCCAHPHHCKLSCH